MMNRHQKSHQLRKVLLVRIVKNGLVRLRKVRLGYRGFRTLPIRPKGGSGGRLWSPRFTTPPIRGSRGTKPPWFSRLGKVLLVRIVKNAKIVARKSAGE